MIKLTCVLTFSPSQNIPEMSERLETGNNTKIGKRTISIPKTLKKIYKTKNGWDCIEE